MPTYYVMVCMAAAAAFGEGAVELSLDGEWDFAWTASSVQEVPTIPDMAVFDVKAVVPCPWDDQLERFKAAAWWDDAQFTTTLGPVRYLTGIGWYRRTLDVPESWRDRAVRLTIGWAVGQQHVWLNGEHLGSYDYGVYTPHMVDLSGQVKPGQANNLVISVDNTRGFAGGWAFLGNAGKASGITRSVTLRVSPSHAVIADLYVGPGADLEEMAATLALVAPAGTRQVPDSTIRWEVKDKANRRVLGQGDVDVAAFDGSSEVSWRARVDGIEPWSPRAPNLYWMHVRWVGDDGRLLDAHQQRFGLRRWTHQGRKLFLNGKPIYLRGEFGAYYYPIHCTTPKSKEHWVRHIARAKRIGMNYINFAARVCPPELLEAADELGMVMQCGDHMTVLQEYRKHCEQVWAPIVRWTRGHPSMCIYGFGGERNYYEGIIEQYQRQYDLIKSMYPDSLVMPQQAIRGIDYAFDEQGKQELTAGPFPHHAERLARYTKACDLFGHYSGGAFGYNYFGTTWQEIEKRFVIYEKPLSMHELFMGMSYLNPDNAAKYTGRVPPYLYTQLEEDLREAGLLDRWRTYHANSSKLQGICKKYCLEKTRKCDGLAGFEFLGMTDMHFTPHYTTGILDEFGQLKPGDTLEGILRYNGESVLLLDFADGSINRSFWGGTPFEADVMVSLYGDEPIAEGRVTWALKQGQETALEGAFAVNDVPNGYVTVLRKLELVWPDVSGVTHAGLVTETTRYNLTLRLTAPGYDLTNDWDFWVFPKLNAPEVHADADEKTYELLSGRHGDLAKLSDSSEGRLWIVSRVTEREVAHMANGGDVLLLGTYPFLEYDAWTSFRPGLGTREHHNVGTVIDPHRIFAHLPHEGWGDWQFYPVLEGASCIYFEDELDTPFDPILEIISSAEHVRKHAAMIEKRVGKGRLLMSTCTYLADNPSCVALMDGMLEYMQSDAFQPPSTLSPVVLARLTKPVEPGDPENLVAAPGFERDLNVKKAWLVYGADYELDATTAHSGSRSLKLTITPEALKNDSRYYTGARAKDIHFKRTPPVLKVAAWHKTQDITEAGGHSFLIFIYINYRGGGRYTLRMDFEGGTHDWQYAETTWKPEKELASATLYIGMAHRTGTAWIDDVYFGPAAAEPSEATPDAVWSREPVTLDFDTDGWFRVNDGPWTAGRQARVTLEGITQVAFKKTQDEPAPTIREVRIDATAPVIVLKATPALNQEGGVYFATPQTAFTFEADDALSGVVGIEVSLDGQDYAARTGPLRLPSGKHQLRCRATDAAGNITQTITGPILTGGETEVLEVTVR